jgi:hypothetical protein
VDQREFGATMSDVFSSPISPKRKRDSLCANDTDADTDGTGAACTENVAVQPTTPTRLLGRLRARSPFRRANSVRRTSSTSRLATASTTESRDGDDDNDDDDENADTPTKRARRDAVLTALVVKKNRGRLLAASQKRVVRLAGAQLSFAADDVTASFLNIFSYFVF